MMIGQDATKARGIIEVMQRTKQDMMPKTKSLSFLMSQHQWKFSTLHFAIVCCYFLTLQEISPELQRLAGWLHNILGGFRLPLKKGSLVKHHETHAFVENL